MNRRLKRALIVGAADLVFAGIAGGSFYAAGVPPLDAAGCGFLLSWAAFVAIGVRAWADRDRQQQQYAARRRGPLVVFGPGGPRVAGKPVTIEELDA